MPETNDFEKILLSTNLVNAKNLDDLDKKERELSSIRIVQLSINSIKGNFDYQHLKDIHKHIFKDIYTWAGKDRYEMGLNGQFLKGNQHFVPGNELPKYSKIIFDELKEQNFLKNCKNIDDFAKNISIFMMELNALHPFREGNGRTQRIFLNELATNAGYKMDLNLVSEFKMVTASKLASKLRPDFFEKLIKENLNQFPENNKNISQEQKQEHKKPFKLTSKYNKSKDKDLDIQR